jgi:hypothetical protein
MGVTSPLDARRGCREEVPELLYAQQQLGNRSTAHLDHRYSSTCLEVLFVFYALAVLWVSMTIRAESDMAPGTTVLIYMAIASSPMALVGLLATVTKITLWLGARSGRRTTVP